MLVSDYGRTAKCFITLKPKTNAPLKPDCSSSCIYEQGCSGKLNLKLVLSYQKTLLFCLIAILIPNHLSPEVQLSVVLYLVYKKILMYLLYIPT